MFSWPHFFYLFAVSAFYESGGVIFTLKPVSLRFWPTSLVKPVLPHQDLFFIAHVCQEKLAIHHLPFCCVHFLMLMKYAGISKVIQSSGGRVGGPGQDSPSPEECVMLRSGEKEKKLTLR